MPYRPELPPSAARVAERYSNEGDGPSIWGGDDLPHRWMWDEAEAHVGVNDPDVDPRELRWRYEPAYPERKLIGAMPGGRRSWEKWYAEEVEFDEELGRSGYMEKLKSLTEKGTIDPIVVIEDSKGAVEGIWDGWHRSAGLVVGSARSIPAIVGRRVDR